MNNQIILRAKQLAQAGQYPEALVEIARLEESECLTIDALLLKARILQLSDDDGSLDEVEAVLKEALRLDPTPQAHLEMGWFLLNVLDDPGNAHKSFEAALDAQVLVNTEILAGIALSEPSVLHESGAVETIENLTQQLVDAERLGKALNERYWK